MEQLKVYKENDISRPSSAVTKSTEKIFYLNFIRTFHCTQFSYYYFYMGFSDFEPLPNFLARTYQKHFNKTVFNYEILGYLIREK
jgi:hypothetical protein